MPMQARVLLKDDYGNCLTTGVRKPRLWFPGSLWFGGRAWWAVALCWPRRVSRFPSQSLAETCPCSHLGISSVHWHS